MTTTTKKNTTLSVCRDGGADGGALLPQQRKTTTSQQQQQRYRRRNNNQIAPRKIVSRWSYDGRSCELFALPLPLDAARSVRSASEALRTGADRCGQVRRRRVGGAVRSAEAGEENDFPPRMAPLGVAFSAS